MGILVSQLPPSELARLKAELAETLVSSFCYPRFYDYRTDSLRMRPVDRAKRQEVWHYLSSVDFNAWGRIDLMTTDLQRQVERLIIHFVQRNRSFFGEQGRKRMADVRMLISASSSSVVEGLRGHLTGRTSTYGNPRPVTSWATSDVTGRPEPSWEQIVATTMLLQQQLQEARGEIKAGVTNDARPNGMLPKRSARRRSTVNGGGIVEPEVMVDQLVKGSKPAPQREARAPLPFQRPKVTNPLASPIVPEVPTVAASAPPHLPVSKVEQVVISEETPTPFVPAHGNLEDITTVPLLGSSPEEAQVLVTPPTIVPGRDLTQTTQAPFMEVTTKEPESATVLMSDEDVVIFEQMRHQLIVWIRLEAVRCDVDISDKDPSELLEVLRRLDGFDETHLQVVSTLLDLSDQIIESGHAGLLEYKQAMMFYLMHSRPSR